MQRVQPRMGVFDAGPTGEWRIKQRVWSTRGVLSWSQTCGRTLSRIHCVLSWVPILIRVGQSSAGDGFMSRTFACQLGGVENLDFPVDCLLNRLSEWLADTDRLAWYVLFVASNLCFVWSVLQDSGDGWICCGFKVLAWILW